MTNTIPYYVVRDRNGSKRGYWCPTPRMKAAGFSMIACGLDGPNAWSIAATWNERWQATRRNTTRPLDSPARKRGYVYFLKVGDRLKIGFSAKPHSRVASLATGLAASADLMLAVRGTVADEKRLHRQFDVYRRSGEWFDAAPAVMRVAMRSLMFGRIMPSEGEEPGEQCRSDS